MPVLDTGAERARFERRSAEGVHSFATSRVHLYPYLAGLTYEPPPYRPAPTLGLAPVVYSSRAAWLRSAYDAGGGVAPEEFPAWQGELLHLQTFLEVTRGEDPVLSWQGWAAGFDRAESALHWGTVGWVEASFYGEVFAYLDRVDAPAPARAVVELRHALSLREWERVAAAADRLVGRVAAREAWIPPATLLDAAVLAYLRTDRPSAARNALDLLAPRAARTPGHLRNRLLEAMVTEAEGADTDRATAERAAPEPG